MMLALYLYAGIQMLYPITYNPYYTNKDRLNCQYNEGEMSIEIPKESGNSARFYKNDISNQPNHTINVKYKSRKFKSADSSVNVGVSAQKASKLIEPIQNLYAFLGKGFLILVLFWINRKNRFLFFLIHKANTLSDSEVMLRIFNKYYEGCPDKKNNS